MGPQSSQSWLSFSFTQNSQNLHNQTIIFYFHDKERLSVKANFFSHTFFGFFLIFSIFLSLENIKPHYFTYAWFVDRKINRSEYSQMYTLLHKKLWTCMMFNIYLSQCDRFHLNKVLLSTYYLFCSIVTRLYSSEFKERFCRQYFNAFVFFSMVFYISTATHN